MEALPLSEIPRELINIISTDISDFLVGFVKLRETAAGEDAELGGSGTLVQIDNTYGILTAHHVIEDLPKTGHIGLILATRYGPQLHRVTVKAEILRRLEIAHGENDSEGPDLGFLVLPSAQIALLNAKKSFYNLLQRRDRMLDHPPEDSQGIWFLCGFAGELTSNESPEHGYSIVKAFRGICGAGGVTKGYRKEDFDYLEFEVRYGGITEPPESFGGFSGGGLWQVLLRRTGTGELEAAERLLSGVTFYQFGCTNGRRLIKCHGRHSIYKQAIDHIRPQTE